uniref:Uncharacterized protein n=1 Tax=viral metagenome TaxID=1070528 RepID=A0A6C0H2U9_9ZZZZ
MKNVLDYKENIIVESDDEESETIEVKQIQESNITSSEPPQET